MSNVTNIESAIEAKYNPKFIMNNRPSDDGKDIIAWLESLGLKPHMASRCYGIFMQSVINGIFNGIELKFVEAKPDLKLVTDNSAMV